MSYAITVSDVRAGFTTNLPDAAIELAIAFIDTADACLTANGLSADHGRALKLYGVRHMLTMQANSGQGIAQSESAPSGASRSFKTTDDSGTQYSALLKQIDKYKCVSSLIQQDNQLSMMSVGR